MISTNKILESSMENAIETKNEALMRKLIIEAMNLFLENKIRKEDLDRLAELYMVAPIRLGWNDNYQFKDSKLKYVFEELSAIEAVDDDRAKENVKRFILYLEGKDYERS